MEGAHLLVSEERRRRGLQVHATKKRGTGTGRGTGMYIMDMYIMEMKEMFHLDTRSRQACALRSPPDCRWEKLNNIDIFRRTAAWSTGGWVCI